MSMRFPAVVDRRHLLDLAVDIATVTALFGAGVAVRLGQLGELPLHFDNVDPFLRAFAWLHDWLGLLDGRTDAGLADLLLPASAPWLHQFGPGLAWSYVPFVLGAPTLEAAFVRRYLVQALLAPVVFLALRRCLTRPGGATPSGGRSPASYLAGITGALAIGFCGEPFGTAGPGDQTYLAPEFTCVVAVAALFAISRRRSRGFLVAMAVLPWAVMVHPMAIALAPGCLWIAVLVWRRARKGTLALGLLLAACVSIPECVHLWSGQGSEGSAFGETLGYVSNFFHSPSEIWRKSVRAWCDLEPKGIGPLLFASPLAVWLLSVRTSWRRSHGTDGPGNAAEPRRSIGVEFVGRDALASSLFAVFALLGVASLLGFGMALGFLKPYQWRIVLPAHAVTLGLAVYLAACRVPILRGASGSRGSTDLSLVAPAASIALIVAIAISPGERVPTTDGALGAHRWMDRVIAEDAGHAPRWFDAVVLEHTVQPFCWAFTPAVFLEQRMRGVPRETFRHTGSLYLALSGPRRIVDAICRDRGWRGNESSVAVPHGAHFVGRRTVNDADEILIVKLDDDVSSRAWTGWLFSGPAGPRLMLESNHVLPLTEQGYDMAQGWAWFDDAMLKQHMQTAGTPALD